MLIYEFRSDSAIGMEENWRRRRLQKEEGRHVITPKVRLKEGGGVWQLAAGRWQS